MNKRPIGVSSEEGDRCAGCNEKQIMRNGHLWDMRWALGRALTGSLRCRSMVKRVGATKRRGWVMHFRVDDVVAPKSALRRALGEASKVNAFEL